MARNLREAFEPELYLRAAKWAAFRYTPEKLRHWLEDIAADVALRAVVARAQGHTPNQDFFRHMALHSIRRLCYLLRGIEPNWLDGDDWRLASAESEPIPELGPLALWRLQKAWPNLTECQQRALYCMLSGDDIANTERQLGFSKGSLHKGIKVALERIDNPGKFKKSAKAYARRMPTKPISAEAIEAYKLKDRLAARERRARQANNAV